EALEHRHGNLKHRALAVVEGDERCSLRKPFRLREPVQEGGEVDGLPAAVTERRELLGEDRLGDVEPGFPAARSRGADLVVAEDRDPLHASASSRTRRTTFS